MQANWSLILNVLLLVGVIVAIGRLMKARKRKLKWQSDINPFSEQWRKTLLMRYRVITMTLLQYVRSTRNTLCREGKPFNFKKPVVHSSPRLMPHHEESDLEFSRRSK